jgi:hypothetical protein
MPVRFAMAKGASRHETQGSSQGTNRPGGLLTCSR